MIKFILKILCHICGKIQWWLHKLFSKKIAVLSCGGCPNYDFCEHRATIENLYCYYHIRKNRKVGGKIK